MFSGLGLTFLTYTKVGMNNSNSNIAHFMHTIQFYRSITSCGIYLTKSTCWRKSSGLLKKVAFLLCILTIKQGKISQICKEGLNTYSIW